MSSRIRYRKISDSTPYLRQSVQRFRHPTNGALYKVQLNLRDHEWLILDDVSGLVAASGLRVAQQYMKIDVRKALADLGIVLEVDTRVRRKKTPVIL